MSGFALCHSLANGVLALLVVTGIVARGRWGACRMLPLHLGLGILLRIPVWLWPERFYQWDYWFFTECAQVATRLALAAELAGRALRALPRGLDRAHGLQLVVLLGTLAALVVAPGPEHSHAYYMGSLVAAQATYASAWLFVAFLGVVWYHGIPTEQLHRDVALGFTVWALVAGISPHLPEFAGLQFVGALIYPAVLLAWARTAWAPDAPTALSPASLAVLRPWRA